MKTQIDGRLLRIQVDQYSRHYIAKRVIEDNRKSKSLKILDIGGYKGWTKKFFPEDEIIIADLYKVKEPRYVRANALKLPFDDNRFDAVLSFDVLEHIARKDRPQFIRESLRVSSDLVIITAPFNSPETRKAEKSLNNFFKSVVKRDHPWLKEHLKNGLPDAKELEQQLKKGEFRYRVLSSNNVELWMLIQFFYLSAAMYGIPISAFDKLSRFYNSNIEAVGDSRKPPYRRVYAIAKNKARKHQFYSQAHAAEKEVSAELAKIMIDCHKTMLDQISLLKNEQIRELKRELKDIKRSKGWKTVQTLRKIKNFGRPI